MRHHGTCQVPGTSCSPVHWILSTAGPCRGRFGLPRLLYCHGAGCPGPWARRHVQQCAELHRLCTSGEEIRLGRGVCVLARLAREQSLTEAVYASLGEALPVA